MSKKLFIILVFTQLFLVLYSQSIYALGADKAHPWITQQAREIWPGKIGDKDKGPLEAQKEFDPDTGYLGKMDDEGKMPIEADTIMWGSRDEDYTWGCPLRTIPALYHSYSGWENIGYGPEGMSALDWAEKLFPIAVEKYQAGEVPTAYYFLGRVAHLLQDMATPAHVHGDVHHATVPVLEIPLPTYTHCEVDKDLFELYMDTHLTYTYTGTAPDYKDVRSILNDMANIAKKYPSNDALGIGSGLQPWDFSWKWRLKNEYTAPVITNGKMTTVGGTFIKYDDSDFELSADAKTIRFALGSSQEINFKITPFNAEFTVDAGGELVTMRWTDIALPGTREIKIGITLSLYLDTIPCNPDKPQEAPETKETCKKIADELIPQAISHTASLYKLFWSATGIPPYVQDVKVYEGGKLRYHVYWEDVVEKGEVVKREKKFEERGDGSVVADAFGGEEEGFDLDRKWVKHPCLEEGGEGIELEFEITFSQAVSEVKEVTFGLCPLEKIIYGRGDYNV